MIDDVHPTVRAAIEVLLYSGMVMMMMMVMIMLLMMMVMFTQLFRPLNDVNDGYYIVDDNGGNNKSDANGGGMLA